MAANAMTSAEQRDRGFFGHPQGLSTVFFLEMWERFSYYGMRAFLTVFIATEVTKGGLGMSGGEASLIYGLYGSTVYLMSLPGGWIADRFLGQRKAVLYGGFLIMIGHLVLAIPAIPGIESLFAQPLAAQVDGTVAMSSGMPASYAFYAGVAFLVFGTGLLKPNASTMVGQLYSKDDPRRDSGYTIFYMGINIGALIAPWVCGFLAQSDGFRRFLAEQGINPNHSWHFGFGAAAFGMAMGLIQYARGQKRMGEVGLHPVIPSDPAVAAKDRTKLSIVLLGALGLPAVFFILMGTNTISPTKQQIGDVFGIGLSIASIIVFAVMAKMAQGVAERRRIIAMIVLFLGCIAFFGVFEQAGGVISLFTENYVQPTILGMEFPSSYYQSINPSWVILLAPVFAAMWLWLNKKNKEPSQVTKFAIGMVFNAIAIAVLVPTISLIDHGSKISPLYIFVLYMFSTMGELCVSPVGLSSMSKLAPKRLASFVMGIWFLAIAIGYYVAGRAGAVAEKQGHSFLFTFIIIASLVVAALLFVAAGPIKRLLAKDEMPLAQTKT